jgi:hypothetical protein
MHSMSATSRGEFGGCNESTARYISLASDIVMPVRPVAVQTLLQHLNLQRFLELYYYYYLTLYHRKSSFHSKNLQGCVLRQNSKTA